MKEKSMVQARRIEELQARLASELAKAKYDVEKAKYYTDALVAVYRADVEATQVQARETAEIANTRAHWIKSAKELEVDAEALASDDDDDVDDDDDGSVGKDTVLRPSSVEKEASASVPKTVKDKKRKRASASEDPIPKTRMVRKPRKSTIPLTIESVLRLRDEDDKEEENDGSMLADRMKKSIDAPKANESMVIYKAPPRTKEISEEGSSKVPESLEIKDASYLSQQTVGTSEGAGLEALRTEENAPSESLGEIQKLETIGQLREEVDTIRAETIGWKDGVDRLAAEKETVQVQLSSTASQLQGMKEKSMVQARRIEELEARLASELAKAKSDAEKAKSYTDALVAVYRADAKATQVQARETAKTANTRAHWVAELTECRSRRETLEEIHA
ncbi:uncharacterized protein [Nicotiana tomentosiformis]|uniref:uncharacterized protein n=1 Tax=Nicotiana tomentosiformis TaxID=4098 RepID=UPI00388CCC71